MKIACTPLSQPIKDVDLQYVIFGRRTNPVYGVAGQTLLSDLQRQGITAPPLAWDLLSIALSVIAADESCLRTDSSDGWTREIELRVAVNDPTFWTDQTQQVEQMLKFLTGDIWQLAFLPGGILPSTPKKQISRTEDSVCLLSGGVDSLVGAIDLVSQGLNPLLVSQVADGNKGTQRDFAEKISNASHHVQVNHNVHPPGQSERSQRARSIIFLTFGVLGATSLVRYSKGEEINLYVPENGLISLNIPFTPLRLGSLSTRTTHPIFIGYFQSILEAAQLRVRLNNPYQLKTKGQMIAECRNQPLLQQLILESTSCGRFARMGFIHCGRCIPCLVRRAALHNCGVKDKTKYRYTNLSINDSQHRNFDDVRSACFAVERVKAVGLDRWIGGALSFPQLGDTSSYRDIAKRGIDEIANFLRAVKAL